MNKKEENTKSMWDKRSTRRSPVDVTMSETGKAMAKANKPEERK